MQWTFCCWCMSQTASNSIAHQGIYTATADRKNTQPFPLYQSAEWHAVLCECQQILFGDLFGFRAKHNRWEQFSSCQHSPEYNQSMNGAQTGFFSFFPPFFLNFPSQLYTSWSLMAAVRCSTCSQEAEYWLVFCVRQDIWLTNVGQILQGGSLVFTPWNKKTEGFQPTMRGKNKKTKLGLQPMIVSINVA